MSFFSGFEDFSKLMEIDGMRASPIFDSFERVSSFVKNEHIKNHFNFSSLESLEEDSSVLVDVVEIILGYDDHEFRVVDKIFVFDKAEREEVKASGIGGWIFECFDGDSSSFVVIDDYFLTGFESRVGDLFSQALRETVIEGLKSSEYQEGLKGFVIAFKDDIATYNWMLSTLNKHGVRSPQARQKVRVL